MKVEIVAPDVEPNVTITLTLSEAKTLHNLLYKVTMPFASTEFKQPERDLAVQLNNDFVCSKNPSNARQIMTPDPQPAETPEAASERQRHLFADMIQSVAGKVRRGESLAFSVISVNRTGPVDEIIGAGPGTENFLIARLYLQTLKAGSEIVQQEYVAVARAQEAMKRAADADAGSSTQQPDEVEEAPLPAPPTLAPDNPFLPKAEVGA